MLRRQWSPQKSIRAVCQLPAPPVAIPVSKYPFSRGRPFCPRSSLMFHLYEKGLEVAAAATEANPRHHLLCNIIMQMKFNCVF